MTNDELLARLAAVGYPVGDLYQLAQSGKRYTEAIPVLVEALEDEMAEDLEAELRVPPREAKHLKQVEGLARALSVPWAKKLAPDPLIRAFRRMPLETGYTLSTIVHWTVGNALEVIWDDSRYDELVSLIHDRRYGEARQMIVLGARKSKRPEAVDMLLGLLDDFDVSGYATEALSKLKNPKARPGLEKMADDERDWVRKYAKRGLDRLDKLGL
jgi:hypothetical protein